MKEEKLSELFIEELEELINKMKSIIIKIDNSPNNPDFSDQIRLIFHTIKGNSGFMGLRNLHQFSFQLESLFTKNVIINASIIQILQESIIIIEKYIEDLNRGGFLDLELSLLNKMKNQINNL